MDAYLIFLLIIIVVALLIVFARPIVRKIKSKQQAAPEKKPSIFDNIAENETPVYFHSDLADDTESKTDQMLEKYKVEPPPEPTAPPEEHNEHDQEHHHEKHHEKTDAEKEKEAMRRALIAQALLSPRKFSSRFPK